MAVGKNKGLSKGGKKGVKKKMSKKIREKMVETVTEDVTKTDLKGVVSKLLPDAIKPCYSALSKAPGSYESCFKNEYGVDPFTRKDWYDVKAPSMFANRQVGKTLVNRTQGTKIASEGLKFRVFEVSLADLQSDQDAERSFRKFRLIAEDVQGRNVLTNFHGMDLTTDKLRSMVKKWQTLIEANVDVKTTDGYLLRVFCIGFTNKDQLSTRKTCYAQHAQVKKIRQKMVETITEDVTKTDLKGVVSKLLPDATAKDIEKASQGIYPLHDVYIRKVKVLKKPRFELSKLLELHGDGGGNKSEEVGESGSKVDRPEGYEPPVQESV